MIFSERPIEFKVNRSTTEPENQDFEEGGSPLDNYRHTSSESFIVDNSFFDIGSSENNETMNK